MPALLQGDIFSLFSPNDERSCFVVFGHFGFNEMHVSWQKFRDRERSTWVTLSSTPFEEYSTLQQMPKSGPWVRFIQSHGMPDEDIRNILLDTAKCCAEQGVRVLWTNGISHGNTICNTSNNREGNDKRAELLVQIALEIEHETGLRLRLISLNDVFVRNHALFP